MTVPVTRAHNPSGSRSRATRGCARPAAGRRRAFAPTPATLDAATLATLRRRLEDQRDFRRGQLAELERDTPTRPEWDAVPAHREVRAALLAGARQALGDAAAALWSLDEGCYGTCRSCGRELDVQLLLTVPATASCPACR